MNIAWLKDIDESYQDFISAHLDLLTAIYQTIKNQNYTPHPQRVLRVLKIKVSDVKVVIIGQDPYFNYYQDHLAACGRAYEINGLKSFKAKFKQTSLKNILRLIYKSYYGRQLKYSELKDYFETDHFIKVTPRQWFDSLERQGVMFLNTALTTVINQPLSHYDLWQPFSLALIKYLNDKNPNIYYFLWGKYASNLKSLGLKNTYISRHPMMCSDKYKDDFMHSKCFIDTKKEIDWLGNV